MCLTRRSKPLELAMRMDDLLSTWRRKGNTTLTGPIRRVIQRASLIKVDIATNSDSVEECATVFCFLDIQWTREPPRNTERPVTENRSTDGSPWLASEYTSKSREEGHNLMPNPIVPFRYQRIRFAARHAVTEGARWNCAQTITADMISGRVHTAKYSNSPMSNL